MIDIAISGPESSGKTALAIRLAVHYKTFYVPEFARTYLELSQQRYSRADMRAIIRGQLNWWRGDDLRLPADALRFWDGDPSILRVWEHERFDLQSEAIEVFLKDSPPQLTLLCAPDLPWQYDPLRENPEDRQRLYDRYQTQLETWSLPYRTIKGQSDERTLSAIEAIDQWLLTRA